MRTTLWSVWLSMLVFLPAASADALAQAGGSTGNAIIDAFATLLQGLGIPASVVGGVIGLVVFLCGQLGKAQPMDLRFRFRGRLFAFSVQVLDEDPPTAVPRLQRRNRDPLDPPEREVDDGSSSHLAAVA